MPCDSHSVVDGERGGGVRPHVQFLDAEVDAVCSCLYRCRQGLARAHGSHDFKVFYLHLGDKGTTFLALRKRFCMI